MCVYNIYIYVCVSTMKCYEVFTGVPESTIKGRSMPDILDAPWQWSLTSCCPILLVGYWVCWDSYDENRSVGTSSVRIQLRLDTMTIGHQFTIIWSSVLLQQGATPLPRFHQPAGSQLPGGAAHRRRVVFSISCGQERHRKTVLDLKSI